MSVLCVQAGWWNGTGWGIHGGKTGLGGIEVVEDRAESFGGHYRVCNSTVEEYRICNEEEKVASCFVNVYECGVWGDGGEPHYRGPN